MEMIPSDDSKDKFLCNELVSPDALKVLYNALLDNQETRLIHTFRELSDRLDMDVDPTRKFFDSLHLISSKENILVVPTLPEDVKSLDENIQFQVFLLNTIAISSWRGSKFSKQAHFLLIFKWVMEKNKSILNFKSKGDLNDINDYLRIQNYAAYSVSARGKVLLKMNEPKLQHWCILADYLGLMRKGPEGKTRMFLTHINDRMFLAFLELYSARKKDEIQELDNSKILFLERFIKWSERNYIMIPSENPDTIPKTISSCLSRLENRGEIQLKMIGDSRSWQIPDNSSDQNHSNRRINSLEIIK